MKTFLNILVFLTVLVSLSGQSMGYNQDFRITDEDVFKPMPGPSFGRDNSSAGGSIFFERTSKQERAFQNLKSLLGDLDKDYFSNCATTAAKCRFIDESNRNNHLAKMRQEARDRAAKHVAMKQRDIQELKADKDRVARGETPVHPDLQASVDRALADLKEKADKSVAESRAAERQNLTVNIPKLKNEVEENSGIQEGLKKQYEEDKAEVKEHAETSKVALDREAAVMASGPIHSLADTEKADDAFDVQGGDSDSSFIRKGYEINNIEGELQGRGQAYISEGLVEQGRRLIDRANTYRNYKNGGTLPYQNARLSDKARKDFAVGELKPDTFVGYENIRLLNAYSELPGEQIDDGLTMEFGVLSQSLLDTSPTANLAGYLITLEKAWGIIDFASGAASGVYESGKGTITGLYQIVTSPVMTIRGIKNAIVNYDKTWHALTAAIEKNLDTLNNCGSDTHACGEVAGYVTGEIVQSLVGGVALKAATTAVKAEKMVAQAGKLGAAISEISLNAVEKGKVIAGAYSKYARRPNLEKIMTSARHLGVVEEGFKEYVEILAKYDLTPPDFPSGFSVNPNLKRHLSTFDGFSRAKGIKGTHNMQAFEKAAVDSGVRIVNRTDHPTVKGIQQIEYQVPAVDAAQRPTGAFKSEIHRKTVYDPQYFSDTDMTHLGEIAAAKGYKEAMAKGLREFESEAAGIKFQVYVRDGYIDNVFPMSK